MLCKEDGDCAWLVEEIRQVLYNFTTGRYKNLYEAKLNLLKFNQGRSSSVEYYEKYIQQVNAFECGGGTLGNKKGVLQYVDEWYDGVIDAQPDPPPVKLAPPNLTDIGEGRSFTAIQVEVLQAPLAAYVKGMTAGVQYRV